MHPANLIRIDHSGIVQRSNLNLSIVSAAGSYFRSLSSLASSCIFISSSDASFSLSAIS